MVERLYWNFWNCRPGAVFLNISVGETGSARYSCKSARFPGNSGGTAECFALRVVSQGVFAALRQKSLNQGEIRNGKRITKSVRAPVS